MLTNHFPPLFEGLVELNRLHKSEEGILNIYTMKAKTAADRLETRCEQKSVIVVIYFVVIYFVRLAQELQDAF